MNQFKNPVYTTSQRRFINRVNAVDCSQQRIPLTEARSLPPLVSGKACSNTRWTRFGISSSQESVRQVETSSSHLIKTIFSRGKNRGSPRDLYIRLMYLAPRWPKRLTACNFGPQIVSCNHRKCRIRIVSSSSLGYLTQLATQIARWCQISQHFATHYPGGL